MPVSAGLVLSPGALQSSWPAPGERSAAQASQSRAASLSHTLMDVCRQHLWDADLQSKSLIKILDGEQTRVRRVKATVDTTKEHIFVSTYSLIFACAPTEKQHGGSLYSVFEACSKFVTNFYTETKKFTSH